MILVVGIVMRARTDAPWEGEKKTNNLYHETLQIQSVEKLNPGNAVT